MHQNDLQIFFVTLMVLPLVLSTVFLLFVWCREEVEKKRWHPILIVCQLWPQFRSWKKTICFWRGEEPRQHTNKLYDQEDILQNLPQSSVECIGKWKTRINIFGII